MGALERKDIITDEALMAPLILNERLEMLIATQDKIAANAKRVGEGLGKGSTEDVKKGIDELTLSQQELVKTQKQIEVQNARNNDTQRALNETLAKAKLANKEAQASTDDWTKKITAQNSSLTELSSALDKNRVKYSALRNEQARNSDEGKKLLSIIQQQAKDHDKLQTSMGKTQQRVGGYTEALEHFKVAAERISPALKSIAPEALEAGEAVGKFVGRTAGIISGSLTLGIAAIALGFAFVAKSVQAYLQDTVEGEERVTETTALWSAALEVVREKMRSIGKAVFDFAADAGNKLIDPETFTKIAAQSSVLVPIFLAIANNMAEIQKKAREGLEIGKLQNDLRREELKLTTELAEITLAKDKALFEARDKVRNSDQERFDQLKDAAKLAQEGRALQLESLATETEIVRKQIELKGVVIDKDKKAYELLQDQAVVEKVGFDILEKYAKLQARVSEIEDSRFQGARRRQALEKQIITDVAKREADKGEGTQNAFVKQQEVVYSQLVAIQAKIVKNQNFSVDEQIEAQRKLTEAQISLSDLAASKELATARKSALGRIEISGEAARKIYDDDTLTLAQKVKLEEDEKEKLLRSDTTYQDEVFAINEAAKAKHETQQRDEKTLIGDIIVANGKYWIELRKRLAEEDNNAELTALDKKFNTSKISVLAYEKQKTELQQASAEKLIDVQLAEYKTQIDNLMTYQAVVGVLTDEQYKTLAGLQKGFSDLELASEEAKSKKKIELYKKAKSETIKIVSELADAIQGYNDARFAADIDASQRRIDLLKSEEEETLKAAGDNKNAKAQIERKYTALIEAETRKQNAIKRKQALFDKRASEFKIVSSVAAGIAQAYEEFPYPVAAVFSALIAAVGVLQLAAIEQTPLPAYAGGTSNHPGGLAIVGDGGRREIIETPDGQLAITPARATLVNMPAGSKVHPNDDTVRNLAMNGLATSSMNGGSQSGVVYVYDPRMVDEMRALREGQPDIVEQAGTIFRAKTFRDGSRILTRAKWIDR